MKKVIAIFILFFFSINYLFAQTLFQQNGLVGLKLNDKVLVSAKYKFIIPVGNLFRVTTVEKEDKVIDMNDNDIIGPSQTIDVLTLRSSILYSVKPRGDSLFYLTDQKGKRISKREYNNALTLFYAYPPTSEYIIAFRKDTSDIYFKGKLIFSANNRIGVTGSGPMNEYLLINNQRNIMAVDTSGHQIAITTGDGYRFKNNYLIISTLQKTSEVSGYPSFLYSVYDKNLKFLFQTKDLIEPIEGPDNLFITKTVSYGIIDTNQKVIVPHKYIDYRFINLGKKPHLSMRNDDGTWTLFNEKCEALSDGVYFDISSGENEYAIVTLHYRNYQTRKDSFFYGLIDSRASLIIQCRFNKIEFNKEKGKYIFNAHGKVYEYGVEEIGRYKAKINNLAKPVS